MILIGHKSYVNAAIVILSIFLFGNSTVEEKHESNPIRDQILKLLNSSEYNNVKRGAMPMYYKYSFQDKCHFLVHSEWYGTSHSDIADTSIPMASIKIEQEIQDGAYFLYISCKDQNKCIHIKGENTGDPYEYMFVQAFIYAGRSENTYDNIKGMFERVICECSE